MYIDLIIPLGQVRPTGKTTSHKPQDHVELNRVFLSSSFLYFTSLYRVFKKVRLASHFQIAFEMNFLWNKAYFS